MAKIDDKEFRNQIKTGNISNAYFIYGNEAYMKNYCVSKLKKKIVSPDFADFNYHQYNGKETEIDDIIKDAETLPLMSDWVVIVVSDYPFADSKADCDAITSYLKDLSETTVMIFWYDTIEVDTARNSKWKAVEAAFSKYGSSVRLDKRTDYELATMIVSRCKKRGVQISQSDARYLVSVSGNDMLTLNNETDKLIEYVGRGEITREHINLLATKSLQARVYDLSKMILRGSYDKAYQVLGTLLKMNENEITLLNIISNCYVDMYRVKCAKIAGAPVHDLENYYDYKRRSFVLDNASDDSARVTIEQLRKSIDVIMEADNVMKSANVGLDLILEETVAKLLLVSKGISYD